MVVLGGGGLFFMSEVPLHSQGGSHCRGCAPAFRARGRAGEAGCWARDCDGDKACLGRWPCFHPSASLQCPAEAISSARRLKSGLDFGPYIGRRRQVRRIQRRALQEAHGPPRRICGPVSIESALHVERCVKRCANRVHYRGTSHRRRRTPLGPCRRPMSRVLP